MAKKIRIFIFLFIFSCCDRVPYQKTFIISGTYLTVTSYEKQAISVAYDEFKRLDKIFNIYDPSSEVSCLNKSYNEPLLVSSEMIELLLLSRQVYDLTEGNFDISQGRVYNFWKKLKEGKKLKKFPSLEEIQTLVKKGGMEFIEINPTTHTVTIKKKGLKLDFSGIAKGFMVDKAVMRLKKEGIKNVLINAGGDIYCLGKNKDSFWEVGIRDPASKEGIIEVLSLFNEAVATSGSYEQFFIYNGKRYSHIINPKTGFPVTNDVLSVTVIAKNCTIADSLATAFFVMGLRGIEKFLKQTPSTMRIFVITKTSQGKKIHVFQ